MAQDAHLTSVDNTSEKECGIVCVRIVTVPVLLIPTYIILSLPRDNAILYC